MADTKHPKSDEAGKPDVVGNAFERTDHAFAGEEDGERLIGKDIPLEEQEREDEEKNDLA
ncbi:hypothetical protein [Jiella pelagia]|uniref:Uncharacterized protein n=1 Tax=Jiella pelagia TaxID=2986949 RepID=A0ABY7C7N7_9HYPH|nr:hypothetical protein [Jiella pelagia]WAP70825.1 hypothetical protein OH818_12975 [Jiella pelagia]